MHVARAQFGSRGPAGRWLALVVAALGAASASAQVIQKELPPPLRGLDLVQKLGDRIPLDLQFTDSAGQKVALGKYFGDGKPVVLALVYYDCPMMCPLMLSRIQERLNAISYRLGEDFRVVTISFDPGNTTQMAAENKTTYLLGYNKPSVASEDGWTFHTSDPVSVRTLAEAVGFPYRYIPESGEYAHGAALTILTPDGTVSGYLDALSPDTGELRLALLQASEGKIARGLADFFLHRCYRYDPRTGAYTLHAMRVMQLGGFLTVMAVATLLVAMRAGERARRMRRERATRDESSNNPRPPGGDARSEPGPRAAAMGPTA